MLLSVSTTDLQSAFIQTLEVELIPAAEWVEDNYSINYRNASPTGIPFITNNRRLRFYRVLRGGAWFSNSIQYRVTDRYARIYLIQTPDTGIRLAKSTLCGNNVLNQDFDGDGIADPQR